MLFRQWREWAMGSVQVTWITFVGFFKLKDYFFIQKVLKLLIPNSASNSACLLSLTMIFFKMKDWIVFFSTQKRVSEGFRWKIVILPDFNPSSQLDRTKRDIVSNQCVWGFNYQLFTWKAKINPIYQLSKCLHSLWH